MIAELFSMLEINLLIIYIILKLIILLISIYVVNVCLGILGRAQDLFLNYNWPINILGPTAKII